MPLTTLPARVWNEMVDLGLPLTRWGDRVFRLTSAGLEKLEEEDARMMERRGLSPMVIVGFLTVRPLLVERQAVTAYAKEHPELSGVLLEVNSVDEAVEIAGRDWPLGETDAATLRKLLDRAQKDAGPARRPEKAR